MQFFSANNGCHKGIFPKRTQCQAPFTGLHVHGVAYWNENAGLLHLANLMTRESEAHVLSSSIHVQVTQHQHLCQNNPTLRQLIEMRNPYIDPINIFQVLTPTLCSAASC